MKFWDDMQSKYAFGDGGSVPAEAFLCRRVYVEAVNAIAAYKGSNIRCAAYNRPGCHNSCLIVMMTLTQFEQLTQSQIIGDEDYDNAILGDEDDAILGDEEFEAAMEEANERGLDDYVIVEPKLSPAFADFVADLSKGAFVTPQQPENE